MKSKKVNPYHTDEETKVHHIFEDCFVGNNIEKRNRRGGTGGYRLCKRCKEILKGR